MLATSRSGTSPPAPRPSDLVVLDVYDSRGELGIADDVVLGYPTVDEKPTPDNRGAVTSFQVGDIYWSQATGARLVRGEILDVRLTERGEREMAEMSTR